MSVMGKDSKGVLLFECPGCDMLHAVYPEGCESEMRPRWTWNSSLDRPTLSPSLLLTYRWCGEPKVCHSFIVDGKIQYLPDCTHALAGQTVDLPEYKD